MNNLAQQYLKQDMLPTLFCPGCGLGIVQHSTIEAIDSLKLTNKDLACVSGIGCSSWVPCYLDLDVMHAIHGRAIAFAEGLKLAKPDKKILVFTGDGDCLAIGGNHFMHAANRNIDITVIMSNNYIYGMTGGQQSPTTPEGSNTKTSPMGSYTNPIDGCKLAIAMGATFVARWTTAHPMQLAKTIEEAINHKGFSFIEVMCQCPVQAGKGVYREKDPTKIMNNFKANTYRKQKEGEDVTGKFQIGKLFVDEEKVEFIDKINQMVKGV